MQVASVPRNNDAGTGASASHNLKHIHSADVAQLQSECGGFAPQCMSLGVALRSEAAALDFSRDVVALALRSYGGAPLALRDIDSCVRMIYDTLVDEASREAQRRVGISEQLRDARRGLADADAQYADFFGKLKRRLEAQLGSTTWHDMCDSFVGMDMDASFDSTRPTPEEETRNDAVSRPHTPVHELACPTPPGEPTSPQRAHKFADTSTEDVERARAAEEAERRHLAQLALVCKAHRERVRFFTELQHFANNPTTEAAAADDDERRAYHTRCADAFAQIFLYAFTHSRNVRIVCCAPFCNLRPSHLRPLHRSRQYAFIGVLPALYHHYYSGNASRFELVLLARHMHTFGFVPLLKSHDIAAALRDDTDDDDDEIDLPRRSYSRKQRTPEPVPS